MASGTRTASITATSTASPARCAPAAAPSSNPRSGRAVGTKEAQHLPGVADGSTPFTMGRPPRCFLRPRASRSAGMSVIVSGRPTDAGAHPLPWNLRFDELRKKGERFLPAEIAGLGRDGLRYPFLHDVDLSTDGHLPQRYRRLHLSG